MRERERLDAWLRQAVMTADDAEALWAWVNTPGGRDVLGAWKRLLPELASTTRAAACAPRGSASCAARSPEAPLSGSTRGAGLGLA